MIPGCVSIQETGMTRESAAIEIRDLRVDYGTFVAVKDVNLSVPCGEVCGLVGPNGAGKTSTFRVLATLMEPTYGEVSLVGIDALEDKQEVRRILGYMPDLAPVPSDLKAWEFLEFYAHAHGLGTREQRRARAEECLQMVNISEKRQSWCHALSRGEKQRLVLAKTLLHRPRVMILDEPASGLDPLARRELRLTLQNLARDGVTVIVSSHILSELAEMCTLLCVMHRGELLASGTAEEVRRSFGRTQRALEIVVLEGGDEIAGWLGSQDGVHDVAVDGQQIKLGFSGDDRQQATLLTQIVERGVAVKTFVERTSSFEEILVQIAGGNSQPEGSAHGE